MALEDGELGTWIARLPLWWPPTLSVGPEVLREAMLERRGAAAARGRGGDA